MFFLCYLSKLTNPDNRILEHVQLLGKAINIASPINGELPDIKLYLTNNIRPEGMRTFLDDLFALNIPPVYQETIQALKKLYQAKYKSNTKVSFVELTSPTSKDRLFYAGIGQKMLNTNTPVEQRVRTLLTFIRSRLTAGTSNSELNVIIKNCNLMIKEKLFSRAFNSLGLEGASHYCWGYTEWAFLSSAQFELGSDNIIRINVKNVTAYKEHYQSSA